MPRILGIDLPNDKPTHVSLRYIRGIGATTAVYSVVYAVVLNPFPYKDVDTLMSVRVAEPGQTGSRLSYTPAQFVEIGERNRIFETTIASTICIRPRKRGGSAVSGAAPR